MRLQLLFLLMDVLTLLALPYVYIRGMSRGSRQTNVPRRCELRPQIAQKLKEAE